MNANELMVKIGENEGFIAAILAAWVLMRVKDERVLEIARNHVAVMPADLVPDWIRILANAASVDAVDDAFDDVMADEGVL